MTPRSRRVLEVVMLSLWVALPAFHLMSGAYRTAWWGLTFLQLALPVLFSLLAWSFRRDMRMLRDRGHLAVPGHRLSAEVALAVVSLFGWIGFATYVVRNGFPDTPASLWLAVGLLLVWLVWFASTMWRARDYAFSLRPQARMRA